MSTPFSELTASQLYALSDCQPDFIGECDTCHAEGDMGCDYGSGNDAFVINFGLARVRRHAVEFMKGAFGLGARKQSWTFT